MSEDKKWAVERTCFIITPIGEQGTGIYRHINGVIENVIWPVLKEKNFTDIKAAHHINDPGSINNQVVNRIVNDDLVIANLTNNNPNVMYELSLRHVLAKPVIHICEFGTVLPFDIRGDRTIFYYNDMFGVGELKNDLNKVLNELDFNNIYKDNPVYNAVQHLPYTSEEHLLALSIDHGQPERKRDFVDKIKNKVWLGDIYISNKKEDVMLLFNEEIKTCIDTIKYILCDFGIEKYKINILY